MSIAERVVGWRRRRSACAIALLVPLFCAPGSAHRRVTTQVTYDREVIRVLRLRCLPCHGDEGGEIHLTKFADARPWAKAIRDEVLSGRMPPWPPRRGVGEFENDRSLSAPAAAILVSWAEGGAPEGNADDLPVGDPVAPPSMDQPADLPILEVRGQRTITQRTIVLSVRPIAAHGESVEVGVVRADGGRQPLVWIPVFDPRRSYTYRLREPIELEPKDRVEVWTRGRGRAELSVKLSDPPSPPSAKPSR